jgi:NADPH:quinone reductase-like Zn-dependent oxidoreductase
MGAGGGHGNAGVQAALHRGARVIAAAGNEAALANARELGAEAAFNYRTEDLEARVNDHTRGAGVNVVFENMADPVLFPQAFNCLGGGGRLVTAGSHAGGNVQLDVKRLYRRKLTIIGTSGVDAADLQATTEGAASGRFRAFIDRILPLSEVREAHRLVSAREVVGKVVMVPDRVLAHA